MSSRFAWTVGGRVVLMVLGALLGIASARLLGPSEKGSYTILTLLPAAVSTLALLGGPQLAIIDTVGGTVSSRLRSLLGIASTSACGLAIAVALVSFAALRLDLGLALLTSSGALALVITEFHAAVVQGQEKFRALALFRVAQVVVPGAPMVIGAAAGGLGPAVVGFALGTHVLGAWSLVHLLRLRYDDRGPLPWTFLVATGTSLSILFLAYRADVFVLGLFSSTAEVGFYSIAVAVTDLLLIPALALSVVRAPRAARGAFTGEKRDALLLLGFGIVAGTVTLVLAEPLIRIVFGVEFAPAVPSLQALVPGAIALGIYRYLASLEMARSHRRGLLVSAALILLSDVVLLVGLTPHWGAIGAGVAASTAYSLGLIVLIVHRLLRAHWTRRNRQRSG